MTGSRESSIERSAESTDSSVHLKLLAPRGSSERASPRHTEHIPLANSKSDRTTPQGEQVRYWQGPRVAKPKSCRQIVEPSVKRLSANRSRNYTKRHERVLL